MALIVLPGCVYLRLLDLRDQCADFDRHLILGPGPGLGIEFRHPVLRTGDVDLLLGAVPSATARYPGGQVDVWAFQRREHARTGYPPLLVTVRQEAGRVVAMDLPQEMARVVPPALLRAGLRALGRARVDMAARRLDAAVLHQPGIPPAPTLPEVIQVLGPADVMLDRGQDGIRAIWRYSVGSPSSAPCALAVEVRPGSSRLNRVIVSVNGLWGYLDLP